MYRIEHNVETGEIKEIPLTDKEIAEILEAQEKAKIRLKAAELEELQKEKTKQAILDKLGITQEEARLLLS